MLQSLSNSPNGVYGSIWYGLIEFSNQNEKKRVWQNQKPNHTILCIKPNQTKKVQFGSDLVYDLGQ